ncbi:MAG TPA: ATP-binding cassette domain-containing protein [Mucilaginibacter sp.]|nr:ATP-binding cassette domain-containing protein [Mucilaginibacter sp.]
MISIEIEKKLKAYKGQEALHIKKQFIPGSITRIYGPSGAGKTTFLKSIAGFVHPEKGRITVNGQTWLDTVANINLPPQKRMAGFVFQDYALFPNMTALQHLQYATEDTGWIKRLLAIGKLDDFSDHKPAWLSGGQQQRLAILRALAIKPQLLLMDEPFSALDTESKMQLIGELKPVFEELEATVLIVTHSPGELAELTNQEFCIR